MKTELLLNHLKRFIVLTIQIGLVGLLIAGGVWILRELDDATTAKPTSEQIQAASIQNISVDDYVHERCDLWSACQSWSDVRKDCATAGDFSNCVSIKLGHRDTNILAGNGGAEFICRENGDVRNLPKQSVSSALQCLMYVLKELRDSGRRQGR